MTKHRSAGTYRCDHNLVVVRKVEQLFAIVAPARITSSRAGKYGIYQKPADGSGSEEPLFEGTNIVLYPNDWSPDGKFLAGVALFCARRSTRGTPSTCRQITQPLPDAPSPPLACSSATR